MNKNEFLIMFVVVMLQITICFLFIHAKLSEIEDKIKGHFFNGVKK